MLPGNYAYMLFPEVGLYKIVMPTPGYETVDCSTLDTAVSTNFVTSSYFTTYQYSYIYGYTDSNNLNSQLLLYYNAPSSPPILPQLEYPVKNIQKYAVLSGFGKANHEYAESYAYGNTVNTNITYPDPNSFTISATQNTRFTVNWNATKPTYYCTGWSDSTINWTLYANPDSTTLNPVAFLTAQKSKMLQGHNLTDLTLAKFRIENVQNYNYGNFWGVACDSTQLWKHPITGSTMYYKIF